MMLHRNLALFVSLTTLLLCVVPTTHADRTSASRVIRLGFLGATNLPNANTQAGTGPALFAVRLALEQFNNQTQFLPNTRIEIVSNNTLSQAQIANVLAYDQILNRGVVGIIGEYNSAVSIAATYPSSYFKVPMISYGSTSPDFTTFHNSTYPYFMRLCPSQISESQLLAYAIANQGWNRVGLVYTTDSPGASGAQAFTNVASTLGIRVVASTAFGPSASQADVYYALSQLKGSGATIFVFIGAIVDQQTIIRACVLGNGIDQPGLGLYGASFQWLTLHASMYTTLWKNSTGGKVDYYYDFAQGLLGVQNFADLESTVYQQYAAAWSAHPPAADLPSVVPTDPTSRTAPANFAYDAFWHFIRALDTMETMYGVDMNTANSTQKALFKDVLIRTQFDGVSGHVSLDINGDRSAPFDIQNFQADKLLTIGKIGETGTVTLIPGTTIQYMGGGGKPLDHVVREIYIIPSSVRSGMSAMTIIVMIAVLCMILTVLLLQDKPFMKAASPIFIIMMLVGIELLLASLFPRIYENNENNGQGNVEGCKADLFLTNLGYTLIVGSLLVKTYRVDSIFRMKQFQQRVLKNWMLICGLTGLLIAQTVLLLGLIYGDPLYMTWGEYNTTTDYSHCSSNHPTTHIATIMAFRFAMLLITAIYCFRIRNIPDEFNESKQLGMVVYNLTFLSVLLPIIDVAMGRGKGDAVIAYGISVFILALVTSCVMLAPKLWLHFNWIEKVQTHNSTNTQLDHSSELGTGSGALKLGGATGGKKTSDGSGHGSSGKARPYISTRPNTNPIPSLVSKAAASPRAGHLTHQGSSRLVTHASNAAQSPRGVNQNTQEKSVNNASTTSVAQPSTAFTFRNSVSVRQQPGEEVATTTNNNNNNIQMAQLNGGGVTQQQDGESIATPSGAIDAASTPAAEQDQPSTPHTATSNGQQGAAVPTLAVANPRARFHANNGSGSVRIATPPQVQQPTVEEEVVVVVEQ